MAKEFKATTKNAVTARSGASAGSPVVKKIKKGTKVTITKTSGSWWYVQSNGWVLANSLKKESVAKKQSASEAKKKKDAAAAKKKALDKNGAIYGNRNGRAFKQSIINNAKMQAKLDETVLDNSTRLFGMPHQFMASTDMMFATGVNLGRTYAQTFMTEAPIVNFTPGEANYMPGMSNAEKKSFIEAFKYKGTSKDSTDILKAIGGNRDERYYNFHGEYGTYMTYVNLLCRSASIYMGLGNRFPYTHAYTKGKKPYKNFDWSTYKYKKSEEKKTSPKGVVGSIFEKGPVAVLKEGVHEVLAGVKAVMNIEHENVQFYVDPATSFQETSTNSSGPSMLEGKLDAVDDFVKEISFLTNSLSGNAIDSLTKSAGKALNTAMGKMSPNNVLGRILGTAGTVVLQGNEMVFPEIWKGSDYSKTYNITVKLTTPYGSKESIYLNIIVPLMHLICLSLPRQSTANSFTSPFIVKASSKGLFSCSMGIVDSLSIEKVQGSYTIDGLPTEVVVQMSLKDLYADLMITPAASPILFFENAGLRDWLVVTCGLDVTKPYMTEKYTALLTQLLNQVYDIPQTLTNILKDKVTNMIKKFI